MLELGMPTLIERPEPEDCARLCRELGLQFVELNMNLPLYQPDRMDIAKLEAVSRQYGIYYTIHLDENLDVGDFNPYVAQAYARTVRETIAIAKQLRAPVLNMHLSRGVYFTLPDRKVYLFETYKDRYQQSMARFREDCETHIGASPLQICVENSGGYTDFQMETLDMLLKSPVFALTFDIGHHHRIGGADELFITARRKKLRHFHFHDADGKRDHLVLGTGEIDLRRYLDMAIQCRSRIVLETKTVEGLRQSAAWMRRLKPGG